MLKNMYTVAGNGPCNEELALRIQAGDKNAAERLVSQNEGYLTELARAYTPWCEAEDLKQEAALALLDAARRFDPAHGTKLLTYATPAIEAALSDYASRYAFPLSVPTSRGSQLRTVAHLCAEAQDTSESELTKAVCEKLKVSSKSAEALLKEYRTLCCARQLGDDVFSVSCGGDPAVAYDRLMRRTLLMQRMEEVLTPRELNLVRSYLGIGQPDEVGMTFQELAIRLNIPSRHYSDPNICLRYYVTSDLLYLLLRFLEHHIGNNNGNEAQYATRRLLDVVLLFDSNEDAEDFATYIHRHLGTFDSKVLEQREPYIANETDMAAKALAQEIRNSQALKEMQPEWELFRLENA